MSAQIVDPADALDYVIGGYGVFTIVSPRTGVRFTYRVKTASSECYTCKGQGCAVCFGTGEDKIPPLFVSLLRGPDNISDYSFIGTIFRKGGLEYVHGHKSRIGEDSPSAVALSFFLRDLFRGVLRVQFWHEGRCGRCGRSLTDPESIERGIGPVCADR